MVYEYKQFSVTIPAGTSIASNFTSSLAFDPRIVSQIDIRVPPGPRGEVGFKIGSGGLQIIPVSPGGFIVTDNEDLKFPLVDAITSGSWQLLAYNTGSYAHTLQIRFYCDLIPVPGTTSSGSSSTGTSVGSTGTVTGTGGTGTTGTGGTGTITPPVTPTPPVVTPPSTGGNPVLLPPSAIIPVSLGGPVLPANPDTLLIGVADLSQVWLLSDGDYRQVASQDDVTALMNGGVLGAAVSLGTHKALIAAGTSEVEIALGPEVLAGWWQAVQRGGVAPRRV